MFKVNLLVEVDDELIGYMTRKVLLPFVPQPSLTIMVDGQDGSRWSFPKVISVNYDMSNHDIDCFCEVDDGGLSIDTASFISHMKKHGWMELGEVL